MDDRLSRLESRVERLTDALSQIERRLKDLERREGRPVDAAVAGGASRSEAASETEAPPESDLSVGLTLVGRTVLALGGAYLLRAVTETGAVPLGVGVALGLLYASAWVYLAYRAGASGRSTSAAFHGASAAVIAYPLLWETTVRRDLLVPNASALLVLAFGLLCLFVARRFQLVSFAWVNEIAVTTTSFALMGGTRSVAPFAAVLVLLGAAVVWFSRDDVFRPLGWLSAGAADLAVLLLVIGGWVAEPGSMPAVAFAVPLAFFFTHTVSYLRPGGARGRAPDGLDLAQAVVATFLGFGGAVALAETTPWQGVLSVVGVAVALRAYATAIADGALELPKDGLMSRHAWLASCLGLSVLLLSTYPFPVRAFVWTGASVAALAAGTRWGRVAFGLHASVYLLAAAVAAGLLSSVAYAFLAPAGAAWPPLGPQAFLVFGVALAAYFFETRSVPAASTWSGLAAVVPLSISLAGVGAGLLFLVSPIAVSGSGDGALLAALRTAVLGAAAIVLGTVSGRGRPEAAWLLYPVLVLGGIKLVIEDFARGRAETLFVALACYGVALILAPRLARGKRSPRA